uniref:Uncharacterized protein n=1 Tax=Timema douglasi TaxID=61478 RepID=A0A7R8VJ47_TIMDO|nr:unnamed protein product [Timema douglasi]
MYAHPCVQTYEYSTGQSKNCWLSSSEHQGAAQFVSCFGRLFILAFVVSRLDLHVVLLQADIRALSIVATFLPSLVPLSWPLTLMYLWGGLAEESLLPVILAIFDNNFSGWVASVYSRDHKIFADIAAHNQGLDGKFRVFSSPLLDAQPPHHKPSTQQEHAKFPITNGSLFTTVDGRHPVIHKYRTRKGTRTPVPHILPQFTSVELTESHLQGNKALQEFLLHNFSDSIHHHPGFMRKNLKDSKQTITIEPEFNSLRPSLSSEHDVGRNIDIPLLDDLHIDMPNQSLGCKGDLNSELKEYDEENEPIYATLSSHSCCSATTAANDDFDFYQHETNDIPKLRKSKVNHTTKLDMHSNSFQLDDKYHSPESQVCKDPIESANTAILHNAFSDRAVPEESIVANTFPKDPLNKAAPLGQPILQKNRPNTSTSGTRISTNSNMFVSPQEFCGYPRADERKYSRKGRSKGKGLVPTDIQEKQVKPTSAKLRQNLFLIAADLSDDNDVFISATISDHSSDKESAKKLGSIYPRA